RVCDTRYRRSSSRRLASTPASRASVHRSGPASALVHRRRSPLDARCGQGRWTEWRSTRSWSRGRGHSSRLTIPVIGRRRPGRYGTTWCSVRSTTSTESLTARRSRTELSSGRIPSDAFSVRNYLVHNTFQWHSASTSMFRRAMSVHGTVLSVLGGGGFFNGGTNRIQLGSAVVTRVVEWQFELRSALFDQTPASGWQ